MRLLRLAARRHDAGKAVAVAVRMRSARDACAAFRLSVYDVFVAQKSRRSQMPNSNAVASNEMHRNQTGRARGEDIPQGGIEQR
jgi:hypothetical protein